MNAYNQRFGSYALQPYGPTLLPPQMAQPMPIPQMVLPEPPKPPGMITPPGMPGVPGTLRLLRDLGGMRTAADFQEAARAGIANPTLGNIGQSFGLGLGLMGGFGVPSTMAKFGLSQLGWGESPFAGLEGFSRIDQDLVSQITSDNPNIARGQLARARQEQAKRNAERGAGPRGATDRSGQVRGGGTGSRSGGLTAGGPR